MTCQEDCRYAEPLPREGGDWYWCAHPIAAVRVVRAGRECPRFTPRNEGDDATPLVTIGTPILADRVPSA